ncbi:MAG: hypothetical protein ACOYXT_02645 [Bacteroidota bacterium]
MKEENELTPQEKEALEKLYREAAPGSSLEDRTVKKLLSQGLIRQTPFLGKRYVTRVLAVAASLLIFITGYYVGLSSGALEPADADYNYLLLLHEDKNFVQGDEARTFAEYSQWMQDLALRGLPITGEKLSLQAVVANNSSARQIDQKLSTDYVTGLFMVKASSESEVLEIVKKSPHLKHGGSIEIRKIVNE